MDCVRAIGLMSGTSMDGIDVAAVETDGDGTVRRGPSLAVPYDAAFRARLREALEVATAIRHRDERPGGLAELERDITLRHAYAVRRFLQAAPAPWNGIALIGFHGQTVLHRPGEALTVQLGDGSLLARETGLPVVFDMRANDMVHGGQGAPLVPAYHSALAHSLPRDARTFPVAFVNIGGIANITVVTEAGDPLAFDTGPGNALIDQWVQAHAGIPYDDGGRIGMEGSVDTAALAAYLADPYFDRAAPKSLDRNDFTLERLPPMELSDGARTLAAVTARSIYRAADHLPEAPKLWIIAGGGRKNANIIRDLRELADSDHSRVESSDQFGFDGDAMEAEAWAYLAVRSRRGLPLTFPTTTGCRKAVTGGVCARP